MNKSKLTKKYLVFAFILVNVACSHGQSKVDKIEKLISTYFQYGKFNGSVLIAEKGKIIYKKGFGYANLEWNIPNGPDTKYRLASITKQFTAMLIVKLVSENKLDLKAPITTYLPDYPKQNGSIITIHHLLTHTSGIPNFTSYLDYNKEKNRDPQIPAEFISYFADSALQFKPGERFEYSNSGYFLLGVIIEKVTGKSYEQALKDYILTPLKMNNTGYDHHGTILKNRATGYEKYGSGFLNSSYVDMSIPYSAGAMYSTVEDLYLWDQALYTEKLLPKKYLDLIFEKQTQAFGRYYGYGWFIGETPLGTSNENVQSISHSGSINGFNTLLTRIPSDTSSIILLNNTGGAPLNEMTIAINGILHDKPYEFPKKSIAFEMQNLIENKGIDAAKKYYNDFKDSAGYDLNESEMNQVGYSLLQSNKIKEAVVIFKINVDEFPGSSNVYDSYGEALLALGKKNEAIENYKISVQLNPGNVGGIKVLKELGVNTDNLVKKVSIEQLKLIEGEYLATNPPNANEEWKIIFTLVNGELMGNDRGYRYKLVPIDDNNFVNPDDGAKLAFDTKDKNAITFMLFEKFKFRKIN